MASQLIGRTASARKSLGEYKAIVIAEYATRHTSFDGQPVTQKRTTVVDQSVDGIREDGSLETRGAFGMYRGKTYATRGAAVARAQQEVERLEAADRAEAERVAEHRARMAGRGR
jgi:hypothetical protein